MPRRDLPKNSRVQIAIAAILSLAAFEMSRWSCSVLRRGSPERIYGESSLTNRRQQFNQLYEAKFGTEPSSLLYSGSMVLFAGFWAGMGLFVTHLLVALKISPLF